MIKKNERLCFLFVVVFSKKYHYVFRKDRHCIFLFLLNPRSLAPAVAMEIQN